MTPLGQLKSSSLGGKVAHKMFNANREFRLGNVNIHTIGMQSLMRLSYLASVDFPAPGRPLIRISTIVEWYSSR